MATHNLFNYFRSRYKVAIDKYETDLHDQALEELSDLLMEPRLPLLFRLKANLVLADGNADIDWYSAESYRKDAEQVCDSIRASSPVGDTRWPAQENELVNLRESLDTLAEDLLACKPNNADSSQSDAPLGPVEKAPSQNEDGMNLPSSSQITAISGGDTQRRKSTPDGQRTSNLKAPS